MKIKILILSMLLVLATISTTGCQLVFEPEVDAVSRLLSSMPTGENRVVRELCSGEKVCGNLTRLAGVVRSDWYAEKKGFYEFDNIEIDEDTGYYYVHVRVRLPGSNGTASSMFPMTFEMERVKLRWYIYKVDGLDEFLRRAERARGIL